MMTWELKEVGEVECTPDNSGVYVVIHRVVKPLTYKGIRINDMILVRADLMFTAGDLPIMSWIGKANAVRKHLIDYIDRHYGPISYEHASYIGYELHRAEVDANYVQD